MGHYLVNYIYQDQQGKLKAETAWFG